MLRQVSDSLPVELRSAAKSYGTSQVLEQTSLQTAQREAALSPLRRPPRSPSFESRSSTRGDSPPSVPQRLSSLENLKNMKHIKAIPTDVGSMRNERMELNASQHSCPAVLLELRQTAPPKLPSRAVAKDTQQTDKSSVISDNTFYTSLHSNTSKKLTLRPWRRCSLRAIRDS